MLEVHDVLSRFVDDLLARPRGPFAFRFVLQPLMAAALALRDGLKDAHTGHAPYFASVLSDAGHHAERLGDGFRAIARILALCLALDAIYQYVVLHRFYPGEAIVIALALGYVPYLLLRGPADRLARRWTQRKASQREAS